MHINEEPKKLLKTTRIKYYIPHQCKFKKLIDDDIEHSERKQKSEKLEINKLSQPFYIVTSKPGTGKSRLLKQVIIEAYQKNIKALFLDLKKVNLKSDNPILTTIQKYVKRNIYGITENIDDNQLKKKYKVCIHTPNFTFKENDIQIICLDALDEVDVKIQFEIIEAIKDFLLTSKNVKLIISCRTFIYKRFIDTFNEFKPHFIEIQPLSLLQVEKYFELRNISKSDIELISKRFMYYSYYVPKYKLVDTPRILEIFTDLLLSDGVKITISKTQAELYETFIYKKLEEEAAKQNTNHKTIVKRVLEKLALVMAIYQVRQITEDELMTFLDGIQSNLSITLLHQISLNTFYERSLLIKNNGAIEFENAEFQEYLAAKEISRLNHIEQAIFDIVFDIELDEFYPNLLYTFKHVIDFKPNLLPQIVDFIYKRKSKLDCNVLSYILPTQSKVISKISDKKFEIFIKTIQTSWNNQVPIWHHQTIQKLSYFYNEKTDLYLAELVKTKKLQHHKDVYSLIRDFNESPNSNIDRLKWKEIFIDLINSGDFSEDISHSVFSFLGTFKDINLFKNIDKSIYENDIEIREQFILGCCKADTNDIFTIDLVFKGLINRTFNIHPYPSLLGISSKTAFLYLFKQLNINEDYRSQWVVDELNKYKLDNFFSNLKCVYDKQIEIELLNFLKSWRFWNHENKEVYEGIVKLIKDSDDNYINNILSYIKLSKTERYWRNVDLIIYFIDATNIKYVIEELSDDENLLNSILSTLYYDEQKQDIYKKAYEIVPEKLDAIKQESINLKKERKLKIEKRQLNTYRIFQDKLEPEPGYYKTDVCNFYKNAKEIIDKFITKKEKERLKTLITDIIFQFNFKDYANITSNDKNNSYTASNSIYIFKSALAIAHYFINDLTPYRKKIIEYLPFATDNHFEKNLLDFLGVLNDKEIELLVDFYQQERTDDLFYINTRNLFKTIEKHRITQLTPLLKKIVKDKRYNGYDVVKALKIIFDFTDDFIYLYEIHTYYSDLSLEKNRIIISDLNKFFMSKENPYKDRIILIIIASIKKLGNDFDTKTKVEIWNGRYSYERLDTPLQTVKERKYLNDFIHLLKHSFIYLKKDIGYLKYSNYIWSICFKYLEKLVSPDCILPYKEVEKIYNSNQSVKGIDAFAKMYHDLKSKYLENARKPSNIQFSINKYNEIKTKAYLQIYNAKELLFIVQDVLEKDIRNFIEQEGFYKPVEGNPLYEKLIQKTIKTQLENSFLRRGFRENEITTIREEELLNGRKPDFSISHGFTGKIIIEIKRANNQELAKRANMENYVNKLIQYIKGTKSNFGIFLIFQTDNTRLWSDLETELNDVYKDEENIYIMGYNCLRD